LPHVCGGDDFGGFVYSPLTAAVNNGWFATARSRLVHGQIQWQ
jgi:hypothetical protein